MGTRFQLSNPCEWSVGKRLPMVAPASGAAASGYNIAQHRRTAIQQPVYWVHNPAPKFNAVH